MTSTSRSKTASLRLRSPRTAPEYLGAGAAPLRDAEDFVDTGDLVELRGARYYFVGRKDGVINVGGLKVHPEEVEAAINRHAGVSRLARQVAQEPDHRRDRRRRRRPQGRRRRPKRVRCSNARSSTLCRRDLAALQGAGHDPFVPRSPMTAAGKLLPPCVTSSSPGGAADWASRSRSSSPPPAIT